VSPTRLSEVLTGTKSLLAPDAIRLEAAFTDLKTFVAACAPIPINFRKAVEVKTLFQQFKAGSLTIAVVVK
jgi:hypothetical protein